jgi:hypothetical protein
MRRSVWVVFALGALAAALATFGIALGSDEGRPSVSPCGVDSMAAPLLPRDRSGTADQGSLNCVGAPSNCP